MDEFIQPVNVDSETVEYLFTCRLETGHGTPGRSHGLSWLFHRPASETPSACGLDLELPKASGQEEAAEGWVEFGQVEQAYALQQPEDWRQLLCKYDRTQHHPGTPPGKSSPTPPALT